MVQPKLIGDSIPNVLTSLKKTSTAIAVERKDIASRVEVAAIVMQTEALKQVRITQQERDILVDRLFEMNFDKDELQRRARSVVLKETYGTVAFKYWIEDKVITYSELHYEMMRLIEKRKKEFFESHTELKQQQLNEEAAREGLLRVQEVWEWQRQEMEKKHAERIEMNCKKLRAAYYHLPVQAKIDLWTKAVQKGIVEDGDKFAFQILPTLIPFMIPEFEIAIKSNSVA